MNLGNELGDQLEAIAQRVGVTLDGNLAEVRTYASQRMLHLSSAIDEPGYQEALEAEALNVAMMAAGAAVDAADAIDRQVIGMIGGALAIGARALSGGLA